MTGKEQRLFKVSGKHTEFLENRIIKAETLGEAISTYVRMWDRGQLLVVDSEMEIVNGRKEGGQGCGE